MNVLNNADQAAFLAATQADLLAAGFGCLRDFGRSIDTLRDTLKTLKSIGDENAIRRADRMLRQLDQFEPSVTMIGQIKSGKTSLVNAMIGAPDLLPADVNPWTSVVTSLHLHPKTEGFSNSASFRFFEEDEWDKLVSGGGRIGELASRAGADDELEKIKKQVSQMREKSRARLGRKFEMLLGQKRDYGYFDKDLIARYVCLGEEPDEDTAVQTETQGRFADITKSADLHMQRTSLPMRLCLRDTPGVNDTFMMREQITIRAIRDSRICVVVLSAHQALTSTDMALIRLISHVKSRDVIIFVNRIDELPDPATQVPQIRDSIAATLEKHKGPTGAEVIFGSALWASYALNMELDRLPLASEVALSNWAASQDKGAPSACDEMQAWNLSGLPELQSAIGQRIVSGVGASTVQRIGASARNLASGLAAADKLLEDEITGRAVQKMESHEARGRMQALCTDHKAALEAEFDAIVSAFAERMERVQDSFLDRATASLVRHLEQFGELSPWTYDPAGLRVLLSASHKVLGRNSLSAFDKATQAASVSIAEIYLGAFGMGPKDIAIARPNAPQVPPPVTLGRTIALDLGGSWWKRWWVQRRGYKAYAAGFYDLIKSETNPVISELRDDLAQSLRTDAIASFDAFLNEQLSVFETLDRRHRASPEEKSAFLDQNAPQDRRLLLQNTLETLSRYAGV